MPEASEPLFPLLNRRAPVLERVRERVNGASSSSARTLAREVANAIELEEEEQTERANEFSRQFRNELADQIGVEPEHINIELVTKVGRLIDDARLEDSITADALETLASLEEEDEEEEDNLFGSEDSEDPE